MLKLIVIGLAAGAAVQAFRQWPANGPVTTDAAVAMFVLGIGAAYLAGRGRRRPLSVTATATATAEATATADARQAVNVINVVPGHGARPEGFAIPTDQAPWLVHAEPRQLDLDDLDGMDLAELIEPTPETNDIT